VVLQLGMPAIDCSQHFLAQAESEAKTSPSANAPVARSATAVATDVQTEERILGCGFFSRSLILGV